jgi:hypothetical protein
MLWLIGYLRSSLLLGVLGLLGSTKALAETIPELQNIGENATDGPQASTPPPTHTYAACATPAYDATVIRSAHHCFFPDFLSWKKMRLQVDRYAQKFKKWLTLTSNTTSLYNDRQHRVCIKH